MGERVTARHGADASLPRGYTRHKVDAEARPSDKSILHSNQRIDCRDLGQLAAFGTINLNPYRCYTYERAVLSSQVH
jgi:hypothetical protein